MYKHLYVAMLLVFSVIYTVHAQQALTIRVLDQEQAPIAGATVAIDDRKFSTNAAGETTVSSLKPETFYQLTISTIGFERYQRQVSSSEGVSTHQLTPALRETGEVFVSATRAKENASTTFKNISKEEIKKMNLGQDIPFLLDQTPGVVISSDAGAGIGYTGITIRGSDNERINVTLNGIPLNDAESMGSFFVNLPDFASSVESIQIQRGVGTSTNGAGAFGASLNIQTDVLETTPYAELNNTFGSFNSWKNTIKVGSGLLNNKFAFNARLSRIASDGYVERAKSNMKSFYLDGGLYTDRHILKATVFAGDQTTYQAWYGTPEPLLFGDRGQLGAYADALELYDGPERDRLMNADRRYNYYTYDGQTDNYTQTHSHLQYIFNINEQVSVNAALHYTKGAGYFEEYRENDQFANYGMTPIQIGGETIDRSDLVRRRWLDNHFYGTTYSVNYTPNTAVRLTFGGAYNEYVGDHFGEVIWAQYASDSNPTDKYYLNDAKKTDFNVYGKADYRLGAWLLNLDMQYRNVGYQGEGPDHRGVYLDFEDNLNFINPKAGFTYFLNQRSNFYASYAFANKEPVRKDYTENPLDEFPRPERMHDVEAGYRYRGATVNIGTNVYGMFYKDQLIATGALNDVGGSIRQNVPDSYRTGVEMDASWRITPRFSWSATAAVSANKINNFVEYVTVYDQDWNYVGQEAITYEKTNIALSANTILSNDFTYRPVDPLSLSLTSKYVSRMYLDNTSDKNRSIAPSFVNNLRALYSFSALGLDNVDLNLAINNLFNAKYQTNGYTWGSMDTDGQRSYYNFYYPQATTNFLLGLNIRF